MSHENDSDIGREGDQQQLLLRCRHLHTVHPCACSLDVQSARGGAQQRQEDLDLNACCRKHQVHVISSGSICISCLCVICYPGDAAPPLMVRSITALARGLGNWRAHHEASSPALHHQSGKKVSSMHLLDLGEHLSRCKGSRLAVALLGSPASCLLQVSTRHASCTATNAEPTASPHLAAWTPRCMGARAATEMLMECMMSTTDIQPRHAGFAGSRMMIWTPWGCT